MSIAETFLAELEQEAPPTRESISRVPDDKLSYKPHEKSMSVSSLIGHMADGLKFWGEDDESGPSQDAYLISVIGEGETTQVVVLNTEGVREASSTADRILSLLHEQLK